MPADLNILALLGPSGSQHDRLQESLPVGLAALPCESLELLEEPSAILVPKSGSVTP
jgi:hypothetical protein